MLVLSSRPDLKTNDRLVDAADRLGHRLVVVETSALLASAATDGVQVVGAGTLGSRPGVVIARVGNWRPDSTLAVLEAMVAAGAATPNPASAIRVGRDHWSTIRVLATRGLPVPATLAGSDPETLASAAIEHLGLPVVVKQRRSRMGVGVIRCTTGDHLDAVLDSLWRLGDEVVVQRWLPEGATTVRAVVVNGIVVAAAKFCARAGDWRSNAARGATTDPVRLSDDVAGLAVEAAEALGLGHCGVDLVLTGDGPVVLEVNPTPGFLHLERATGIDVAAHIIRGAVATASS